VVAAAALCLLAGSCSGEDETVPPRLYDGARPRPAPHALAGLGEMVMTRSRVLGSRSPALRRCAARFPGLARAHGGIARTAVDGGSVTFAIGPLVYGCDAAAGAQEPPAWACGGASGKRIGGRLVDARIGLANCLDGAGNPVAFAWVEAASNARWLLVARDGWHEAYPVAAQLPVRVATTTGLDVGKGVVSLAVTHVSAAGRVLHEEELALALAG
jgi:hypothetical protein